MGVLGSNFEGVYLSVEDQREGGRSQHEQNIPRRDIVADELDAVASGVVSYIRLVAF